MFTIIDFFAEDMAKRMLCGESFDLNLWRLAGYGFTGEDIKTIAEKANNLYEKWSDNK